MGDPHDLQPEPVVSIMGVPQAPQVSKVPPGKEGPPPFRGNNTITTDLTNDLIITECRLSTSPYCARTLSPLRSIQPQSRHTCDVFLSPSTNSSVAIEQSLTQLAGRGLDQDDALKKVVRGCK